MKERNGVILVGENFHYNEKMEIAKIFNSQWLVK